MVSIEENEENEENEDSNSSSSSQSSSSSAKSIESSDSEIDALEQSVLERSNNVKETHWLKSKLDGRIFVADD